MPHEITIFKAIYILTQMKCKLFFLFAPLLLSMQSVFAKIELPSIFSSNMVLQRTSDVKLWGWAAPNEVFNIVTGWDNKTIEIKTGNDAKWSVFVKTPKAGGPFTVEFLGKDNQISLENILIGEVWLCSGQSNMEWSANSGIDNAKAEIASADYPNIRLFTVQKRTAKHPQEDLVGVWDVCTPKSMPHFSAVAYFFAKRVQEETSVPIGLIDSSWGASCAEVWTPAEVFETRTDLFESAVKIRPNQWVTTEPSSLYNAMIAPLSNFKIAGSLWYQGESNTANAEKYADLFTTMISSWRAAWAYDFPFYYVQIAPYAYGTPEEGVIVRDQQRKALRLGNTGMAVTSDICTIDDIHPQNKQDVGLRLANIALKEHYKKLNRQVNGPMFKEIKIDGNQLEVHFEHAEGLYSKTKKVTQFEIAGADDVFYPAKARIKNNRVLVSSKEVKAPLKVRFAWSNTDLATLFNAAGLPASSFISD